MADSCVHIDGSEGEGGGQILRTALAMALVTRQGVRLTSIRSRRARPGLLPQHLTAVRAAAEVGQAEVRGDRAGSRELVFQPQTIRTGEYHFATGTAGSATLVLQTVLPPLLTADGPSRLVLEGGTHNPWAPPFDFLERAFLPLLRRMGARVDARLERPGFYPAGGGRVVVQIEPVANLQPIELIERGPLRHARARAIVSRLPISIAERELATVAEQLGWPRDSLRAETVESPGPGNALMLDLEAEHVTEVYCAFGQRGVLAEQVAADAVAAVARYLAAGVPVGEHLADQLLLPLALAGRGAFRTLAPSGHTLTNLAMLQQFVPLFVETEPLGEDDWRITLARR